MALLNPSLPDPPANVEASSVEPSAESRETKISVPLATEINPFSNVVGGPPVKLVLYAPAVTGKLDEPVVPKMINSPFSFANVL